MWQSMLNDRCDIYHLQTEPGDQSYGLPTPDHLTYPDAPDIADVPCHFKRFWLVQPVTESAPRHLLNQQTPLDLPLGTDVRMNDKIVDRRTGLAYTAGPPVPIRNHHIRVSVSRMTGHQAV